MIDAPARGRLEQHLRARRDAGRKLLVPYVTGGISDRWTELLRAMKARDEWRHIVRVIISTDGSDSRRLEAADLSVTVYVEKPFRPEVMRDVLAAIAPAS